MCDCCTSEKRNFKLHCGPKASLSPMRLYQLKKNKTGKRIKGDLCSLCQIDLFLMGERRFFKKHNLFAQFLGLANPNDKW